MPEPLRIIAFGAHPDDCELCAGGVAIKWAALGHHVKFVSVTNGAIGHFQISGGSLAGRRAAEAKEGGRILGISSSQVLKHHDGELLPTLEVRQEFTRLIRGFKADVVLTHRPNDYHPDHRYTSVAVQDAAFMVTVPYFCHDVPSLRKNPYFFYFADSFTKPTPFQADVVVAIDDVLERKVDAMAAFESQFFEWLPWLDGESDQVPAGTAARREWLGAKLEPWFRTHTEPSRRKLIERYGEERGRSTRYVEAFEVCEYGSRPEPRDLERLFPF
jgi:N-acetylglucosamine malate deacetylase 1